MCTILVGLLIFMTFDFVVNNLNLGSFYFVEIFILDNSSDFSLLTYVSKLLILFISYETDRVLGLEVE